jgi:hypothetical protein
MRTKKMTNNPNEFERYFESCLEMIRSGQADIDAAAAQYPEYTEELREQLEIALWLDKRKGALDPDPDFVATTRLRLVSKLRRAAPTRPSWRERVSQIWSMPTLAPVAFVMILMVFMVFSGTIVMASESSIPGDGLYSTKLIMEDLALATSVDETSDAQLRIHFVQRRLVEVNKLLVERRYEEVDDTVAAYADQVNETIESINQVAQHDSVTAQKLALELESILNEQAPILQSLQKTAPISIHPVISKAVNVSESGKQAVQGMSRTVPLRSTSAPAATNTPFPTRTPTPFPTRTPRPTPTSAPTATSAPTRPLPTEEPEPTLPPPTSTPTATAVPPTATPTPTNTRVPPTNPPPPTDTPTATNTPLPTATNTPLPTATNTPLPTVTNTPLPTATNTPLPTATNTPLPTATNTPLPTATNTPLPTATATVNVSVPQPTFTATMMSTPMDNSLPTPTPTP